MNFKNIKNNIPQFIKHIFAGGGGFLINLFGFKLLISLNINILLANISSVSVAIFATFILQKYVTYHISKAGDEAYTWDYENRLIGVERQVDTTGDLSHVIPEVDKDVNLLILSYQG